MSRDVELLGHGKEPDDATGAPARVRLGRAGRATLAVMAALAVGAAALLWPGGGHVPAPRTASTAGSGPTFGRAKALVPRVHQVRISTTGQQAKVLARGSVDLDLQLVNEGSFPLALLAMTMPQAGVRTVSAEPAAPAAGRIADPLIVTLTPEQLTRVTVHLALLCPTSTEGVAADHLQLTVRDDQGGLRTTEVDLRALPGFWDHVRRSACRLPARVPAAVPGSDALVVRALPTSVRWEDGTNGP